VANLDPKKGHRVLAEAARRVLAERDDVRFVCAGKGERAELDALLDAAGVARDRFVHLGFHDDVPRLLRTLDVSICASTKGEGLTGSIRESLAMGVPVVSTAVAGNVEIVKHGQTGLLVPPRDPDALAAAILETLADPDAARARAEAGAALVRGRFTSAARAERMAELYREIRTYRRVREMEVDSILYPEV
ncbi:MAG: glycosyltransferase family 4 protein, partial [Planctomycetota bacterium JB042]